MSHTCYLTHVIDTKASRPRWGSPNDTSWGGRLVVNKYSSQRIFGVAAHEPLICRLAAAVTIHDVLDRAGEEIRSRILVPHMHGAAPAHSRYWHRSTKTPLHQNVDSYLGDSRGGWRVSRRSSLQVMSCSHSASLSWPATIGRRISSVLCFCGVFG
jgi:hypothetical protein